MKTIPKLRSGLINSKDPALYAEGDREREVVAPINTIKEAFKEAMRDIVLENNNTEFKITLDGTEIIKKVVDK